MTNRDRPAGIHRREAIRLCGAAAIAAFPLAAIAEDAELARVQAAKAEFDEKARARDESLSKKFDEVAESRRKAGKLDELKLIQEAKDAFELDRTIPEASALPPSPGLLAACKQYRVNRDRDREQLIKAYDAAIAQATRTKHPEDAQRLVEERDGHLAEWNADAPKVEVEEIDPRGKPSKFQPGKMFGTAIWCDKPDGLWTWHLRVTPLVQDRVIKGKIKIHGGTINAYQLMYNNQGRYADQALQNDASMVEFTLRVAAGTEDGIDFRITGRDAILEIECRRDDGVGGAAAFLIGEKGTAPQNYPVRLRNISTKARR